MITAVDTNVIVALWDRDSGTDTMAQAALERASSQGTLVLSAPVFAELLACPYRDERFLHQFCAGTDITIDCEINRNLQLILA
jgi:predicted nucleic acid-binding protein